MKDKAFLNLARAVGASALGHPDTATTRAGFAALEAMRDAETPEAARKAAADFVVLLHPRPRPPGAAMRTPHEAVSHHVPHAAQLGLVALAEASRMRLAPGQRPSVVPGTWEAGGLKAGDAIELRFETSLKDPFLDHDADEREWPRTARCVVDHVGGESTGRDCYILLRDVGRPGEGAHWFSLVDVQALQAAVPEAAPAGPARR